MPPCLVFSSTPGLTVVKSKSTSETMAQQSKNSNLKAFLCPMGTLSAMLGESKGLAVALLHLARLDQDVWIYFASNQLLL